MKSASEHYDDSFVPIHLRDFVAKQDPALYSAIDHSTWRFIMKLSKQFYSHAAHQKYLDGLKETGISTERLPLISEMDAALKKFGWRAAGIVGFIPPSVFLEFQSLGILVIACDMRRPEHVDYTPSPDIVHEAAGHAPIIADPDYRSYLKKYGEISRKAIFFKKDLDVYEAIRALSDIKEDPNSTAKDIEDAQKRFEKELATATEVSEATLLARMGWWTIEYGLVGDIKNPKIYGAGLLSSVSESYHCFNEDVKKIPLSIDCVKMGYDITKPQPQLYVAQDFEQLKSVLDDLSKTMAFTKGGTYGLDLAQKAETVTTTELDSGLQISSRLKNYIKNKKGDPVYLQYIGPTQLAYKDLEIENQGTAFHKEGFGTPIGKIRLKDGSFIVPQEITITDLEKLGFTHQSVGELEFDSGVKVKGVFQSTTSRGNKSIILSFENCEVRLNNDVLFSPSWGNFDLALGSKVISVFGNAADRAAYLESTGGYTQKPASMKSNLRPNEVELNKLYEKVRTIRDSESNLEALDSVAKSLIKDHPKDWLLRFELLELNDRHELTSSWANTVKAQLLQIGNHSQQLKELIDRGLSTLKASK